MALSWLWGTSQLDEAVDKATSELIPTGSEDVALNLEICDQIRSKSAPARDAMRALKRRLNHKNPNVQLLALGNGGDHFLVEIASRDFIDNIVSILRVPGLNHAVKSAILQHIQNWALAFDGKPNLAYVGQIYKTLKSDGFDFPPKDPSHANAAMVDTSTAPEWIDSDVCLKCRSPFTFTNRKHHCRNCGQVFDQLCSSKTLPLPHFGITQPVRVCDLCHVKLTKKAAESSDRAAHRRAASMYSPRIRSARDLADAELQRAIQLSLEEVGASRNRRPGYTPYQPVWPPNTHAPSEPPLVDRVPNGRPLATEDEDDPDLRAAIEASLREAHMPRPSAPLDVHAPEETRAPASGIAQSYPPTITPTPAASSTLKLPNYDLEPLESDAILTFNQTVEEVGGLSGARDMTKYPAMGELYDRANTLRPKLAMSLDDTGRKEELLSDMHDKLSQAVKLYDKLLTEQMTGVWRRASVGPGPSLARQSGQQQQQSGWVSHERQQSQQPDVSYAPQQQPAFVPAHIQAGPSQSHSQAQLHASYAYQAPPQPVVPIPPLASMSPAAPPPPLGQQLQAQLGMTSPPPPLLQPQLQPQSLLQPPPHQPQQQQLQQPPVVIAAQPQTPTTTNPISPSHKPARRSSVAGSRSGVGVGMSNGGLVRSGTVGHGHGHGQTQTQIHAQQGGHYPSPVQSQSQTQAQSPAPAPALPQFPVAPTSNPQTFDMYAPSVPVGVPGVGRREERREELLIDL